MTTIRTEDTTIPESSADQTVVIKNDEVEAVSVSSPAASTTVRTSEGISQYTAMDICLHTVTKPYENEVTLRRQNPPLKCC